MENHESNQQAKPKPAQEHPLANILINVLIPVLALSYLSKDPEVQQLLGKAVKPWHIGPLKALIVALIFPISYGLWFFAKTKKMNFFSGLGLFSVLLTGGLTLFLWNKDGTIKENAAVLFGLKEASIPFVLGIAIVASHWSKTPLLRTFLYSDSLFDINKIESKVDLLGKQADYQRVLFSATLLFSASFFISTLLNFGLSMYFLGDLDHLATNAREVYNAKVAKITGWGFAVIGVPIMAFLFFTLRKLLKGLREITGLADEELMMPR
ncbi:VC0807 family protein [Luteolibacter algae]|uniref:VC0807 family protein n=1 Tax=Luteolibacter algae TaxID=454151 RepID=A0ABW5DBX1_9BACT